MFPAQKNMLLAALCSARQPYTWAAINFTVEAINNSSENIYIQSMELNGKPYSYGYIYHRDIINGGVLKIVMGSKPILVLHKKGRQAIRKPVPKTD
jgi:putative alpha-1,2-mannosidase